ncbi:hypothetical protein Poli38472_014617 [Pythium oligandrum]|uniref:Uncharacterized protein n=1 Tax=Pythium oligandrum TaxID=41045 RepID=A0A8K1CQ31_PYTOL|nr:hypothetical protein Poli38472_014617 [Pythium oligandrum]|eukprot:TMW66641.1 hypothetical protein Poli38472_014617 [Pythium oligandrum]
MVMGRSSNIGTLTFNDFQWLDHYILVDVTRLKISDVHHVSVFCSPGLWAIDPLHSLACQMVTTPYSSSNQVFPQISSQPETPEHRVAAYINRVLKSVYETEQPDKITPNLQSQSTRRGGAAFASSNHHVNLSDLAHRGHWTMDGFATLLEYISPTSSSDQTIGKVLGGWHDPKPAGLPPTLNAFSSEPRDVAANVRAFADYLRVRHFSRLNKASFADALTASLLMYLPDTLQVVRNNVVHNEILQVASQVLPDAIDLQGELIRWGRVIKRRFIMGNMQALPVAHIKENLSEREQAEHLINPRTYGEVLERLVIGQQQLFHRQEQIMSMLQDLMRAPRSFECSQSHETTAPSPSKVKKAKAINALAKLQQAKLWPESLSTLKERALSDVLIQVFLVQLHHLLKETGNRAQTDVIKAVDIAEQLADIRSIPPYPDAGDSHRQKEWMDTMRAMANEIERLVLECLEAEKASDPTRQRKRKHTAYINGIVRAWGRRQKKRQRLPSREGGSNSQPSSSQLIAMKDNMAALRQEYTVTQQQEMAAFVMQQVDAAIRERDANGKAAEVADVSDIKDEEMMQ